jgi:hypothetical protein
LRRPVAARGSRIERFARLASRGLGIRDALHARRDETGGGRQGW